MDCVTHILTSCKMSGINWAYLYKCDTEPCHVKSVGHMATDG